MTTHEASTLFHLRPNCTLTSATKSRTGNSLNKETSLLLFPFKKALLLEVFFVGKILPYENNVKKEYLEILKSWTEKQVHFLYYNTKGKISE